MVHGSSSPPTAAGSVGRADARGARYPLRWAAPLLEQVAETKGNTWCDPRGKEMCSIATEPEPSTLTTPKRAVSHLPESVSPNSSSQFNSVITVLILSSYIFLGHTTTYFPKYLIRFLSPPSELMDFISLVEKFSEWFRELYLCLKASQYLPVVKKMKF